MSDPSDVETRSLSRLLLDCVASASELQALLDAAAARRLRSWSATSQALTPIGPAFVPPFERQLVSELSLSTEVDLTTTREHGGGLAIRPLGAGFAVRFSTRREHTSRMTLHVTALPVDAAETGHETIDSSNSRETRHGQQDQQADR